jgi:hypothetical protein
MRIPSKKLGRPKSSAKAKKKTRDQKTCFSFYGTTQFTVRKQSGPLKGNHLEGYQVTSATQNTLCWSQKRVDSYTHLYWSELKNRIRITVTTIITGMKLTKYRKLKPCNQPSRWVSVCTIIQCSKANVLAQSI